MQGLKEGITKNALLRSCNIKNVLFKESVEDEVVWKNGKDVPFPLFDEKMENFCSARSSMSIVPASREPSEPRKIVWCSAVKECARAVKKLRRFRARCEWPADETARFSCVICNSKCDRRDRAHELLFPAGTREAGLLLRRFRESQCDMFQRNNLASCLSSFRDGEDFLQEVPVEFLKVQLF